MSNCRRNVVGVLAGLMVTVGGEALLAQQQFGGGSRKIEFSDPRGSGVASNLNQITSEKAVLPFLQEELDKSSEMFRPRSSLQGIGPRPIPQAPPSEANSKRLRELLDKQREWPFLEPSDYQSEQTIEEIFGIPEYGPTGEVKEKKSPLERYYERLDRASNTATNRNRTDPLTGVVSVWGKPEDSGDNEFKSFGTEQEPTGALEMENPLQQLLRGGPGNGTLFRDSTKPPGFSDSTGNWTPESPEYSRAQAARLEEYRRLLDFPTLSPQATLPSSLPLPGVSPFDAFKSPTATPTAPIFGTPRSPDPAPTIPFTPGREFASPFPTVAGPVGQPAELPEVSSSFRGFSPVTPLPEPVRSPTPAPDFNIPKRRF
jgi:hypothetical protein